jgi:hypothetical protein
MAPKKSKSQGQAKTSTERLSIWVGLIGGALGLAVTIGGGFAALIAYFATREQLAVVDCYQYYGQDSLSYQAEQVRLLREYLEVQPKAAAAKVASQKDPRSTLLQLELDHAMRVQNETYTALQQAQQKSKAALEEQRKCGYKKPK